MALNESIFYYNNHDRNSNFYYDNDDKMIKYCSIIILLHYND
jgi:hypothetical protein